MPPNRKASALHQHDGALRFASLTVSVAKDAIVTAAPPRPDESYWLWPSEHTTNLFSAHHVVANLVRDASLQEQEESKQDENPSFPSDEYWNSSTVHKPKRDVDDRWTSGAAVESALLAQQRPTDHHTNPAHDDAWQWTTFPQSARVFQADHIEQRLVRTSTASTDCASTVNDDYWNGM